MDNSTRQKSLRNCTQDQQGPALLYLVICLILLAPLMVALFVGVLAFETTAPVTMLSQPQTLPDCLPSPLSPNTAPTGKRFASL
jgi:hypothetical protein